MTERPDVDAEILGRVRGICLALAEVDEEAAWVGTRWRVHAKTFAHVLLVDGGWPPAYARAAGTAGPATVLMFRSAGDELEALRRTGAPFFSTPWRADEVGAVLDADTDWREVAELLTESYRIHAPRRLRSALDEGSPGPHRSR